MFVPGATRPKAHIGVHRIRCCFIQSPIDMRMHLTSLSLKLTQQDMRPHHSRLQALAAAIKNLLSIFDGDVLFLLYSIVEKKYAFQPHLGIHVMQSMCTVDPNTMEGGRRNATLQTLVVGEMLHR